jgi:hypothetical protein
VRVVDGQARGRGSPLASLTVRSFALLITDHSGPVVPERMAGPFSFPASAVLASLADVLADGPAPSWLVRVGTSLGRHFPARNLLLCIGRPGLLL